MTHITVSAVKKHFRIIIIVTCPLGGQTFMVAKVMKKKGIDRYAQDKLC